ncbi:MAG: methionine--tRNA ligase [Candidatus Fonsibacter ubiquis]|nr:methionine--tRNA ligase [Candidatus Fonsibacter ubiquis]
MKNFYLTTPIYYPSAKPHMGHAYSSISADVIARFKRIEGYNVNFLTGTDEHGLKIQRAAEKQQKDPKNFCDEISRNFIDLAKKLNLTNTDFIRTTEDRHKKTVSKLWNILEEKKEIYISKYSGWYSVSDEAFYNEDEIETKADGKVSKVSGSKVEWMEEESYFFKLSKWQEPLLKYYEDNPDFIAPLSRKNEVISFVKSGLKDLSIRIPLCKPKDNSDLKILNLVEDNLDLLIKTFNKYEIHNYLKDIIQLCSEVNKYVNDSAPWSLKDDNLEKRNIIIYTVLEFVRKISILLQPIIPEKTKIILDSLNVKEDERFIKNINKNSSIKPESRIQKINILFKKQ